jgi:molybdopterin-guanine dinucleotide biosynthesis protein A
LIVGPKGGAAILAGGKSRRMGRDKATIEVGGRTLLQRCVSAVESVAAPVVIISDRVGRFRIPGCREVVDLYPDAGPVGGIVTALTELGYGAHLVVACDMPFLQTRLMEWLLHSATDEYDSVVPRPAGRPEPLCAVYRHTCIEPLRNFLDGGGRAAHLALQQLRTRYIDEEDLRRADPQLRSFINLNTPDDFLEAVADEEQSV